MLDRQKIAFITCVNDEDEYAECRYYIERLHIPEGYAVDVVSIREAPSMTAGYNRAMRDSDAKYKVYLHQDVFIKERDLIPNMLAIFNHDEQIGMLGVVGKKEIGSTVFDMMKWDTGKVICGNVIMNWQHPGEGCYAEVTVADGLLLATQYDIPWREDIFNGWDFYDLSQCIEYKKAGYKVVVPHQEKVWCNHGGVFSEWMGYCDQYDLFFQEYHQIVGLPADRTRDELIKADGYKRHAYKVRQLKAYIGQLFAIGEKKELRAVFQNRTLQDSSYLVEYRAIVYIDQVEEQSGVVMRFWQKDMTLSQLLLKLRKLKYALKRIEYDAYDAEVSEIQKQYSKYAIMEVCSIYVTDREKVYGKLEIKSQGKGIGIQMKKVSVIVPCYNAADYLDKCIGQLLHQTIGIDALEIILVDDASTDGGETKRVIQRYEQHFPETIMAIFLEENMRQGGARNVGVSYATGEYITFCDADDWLLEEALEHAYHAAKEYDADVVAFARTTASIREGCQELVSGSKSELFGLEETEKRKRFLLHTQKDGYGSQNKLFSRSLIQENHIAFAEHLVMEEPSFTLPVRLYAKRYYYLDEGLYVYYLSPESTLRAQDWESKKWDDMQVWMILMEGLKNREVFRKYRQEIEYLFFTMGYGWSLGMLFQRRGILTKEEWKTMTEITRQIVPDIRDNPYIQNADHPFSQAWNDLLLAVLEMEFTDENAKIANQAMLESARAFSACPALC